MGYWREIDHTADLALEVHGRDLGDLFISAARGMSELIAAPDSSSPGRAVPLALDAPDVETLLVDWLNELLYLGEMEDVVFVDGAFTELSALKLRGQVELRPVAEHRNYVKAATYHNLQVRQTSAGYAVTIVLDT